MTSTVPYCVIHMEIIILKRSRHTYFVIVTIEAKINRVIVCCLFQQHHHQDDDVQIIAEHRPGPPHHYIAPTVPGHGGALSGASPPVLLQEPAVHPTPHDLYVSYYYMHSTV